MRPAIHSVRAWKRMTITLPGGRNRSGSAVGCSIMNTNFTIDLGPVIKLLVESDRTVQTIY